MSFIHTKATNINNFLCILSGKKSHTHTILKSCVCVCVLCAPWVDCLRIGCQELSPTSSNDKLVLQGQKPCC